MKNMKVKTFKQFLNENNVQGGNDSGLPDDVEEAVTRAFYECTGEDAYDNDRQREEDLEIAAECNNNSLIEDIIKAAAEKLNLSTAELDHEFYGVISVYVAELAKDELGIH